MAVDAVATPEKGQQHVAWGCRDGVAAEVLRGAVRSSDTENRGLTVGPKSATTHRPAPLLGSRAGPVSPERNPAQRRVPFVARGERVPTARARLP
jgi:hypothetical protein